mmetsp:Transcript_13717/g.28068  ORF Transcript_13717/g.28068 Transcript_13717/m.28068 type:complete len:205 (-) Transcript_13717:851-1465(-)
MYISIESLLRLCSARFFPAFSSLKMASTSAASASMKSLLELRPPPGLIIPAGPTRELRRASSACITGGAPALAMDFIASAVPVTKLRLLVICLRAAKLGILPSALALVCRALWGASPPVVVEKPLSTCHFCTKSSMRSAGSERGSARPSPPPPPASTSSSLRPALRTDVDVAKGSLADPSLGTMWNCESALRLCSSSSSPSALG